MRRLKNVVTFIQTILSFVLSRNIINIYNDIASKYGNFYIVLWYLQAGLYKSFFKFKENVPKYGRTMINSFLGTVGAICSGTYNLCRNVLIH